MGQLDPSLYLSEHTFPLPAQHGCFIPAPYDGAYVGDGGSVGAGDGADVGSFVGAFVGIATHALRPSFPESSKFCPHDSHSVAWCSEQCSPLSAVPFSQTQTFAMQLSAPSVPLSRNPASQEVHSFAPVLEHAAPVSASPCEHSHELAAQLMAPAWPDR